MRQLRANWRVIAAGNGLRIALATFAACGGTTGSTNDVTGAGGGAATLARDSRAACDHYFDAQYGRCGGPRLPADETARIRGRFEQVCANQVALPGSGITATSLEQCASALDVSACQFPSGPPVACQFHGSLAGGAACADDVQCVSARCQGTQEITPGGPTKPITCGTCEPAVAVGKVCGQGEFSAGCGQGAICITADTTATESIYACVALAQQDVGAPCDTPSATCKAGLYCSLQTRTCAPLAAAGAACGEGRGWLGGCAAPLGCGISPSTCRSGTAGAACVTHDECAPGFGCVPGPCAAPGEVVRIGCSTSGQCVAVEWAEPGEPCSAAVPCLVGSCYFGSRHAAAIQQADGSLVVGVCPTVLADGAPCDVASTCDTFAQCFQGKCTLLDAVSCQ